MSIPEHSSADPVRLRVPNHTLLRQIGHGRHGEVWLACDAAGAFRAVTVVRRSQCKEPDSFAWEWHDVAKHQPVSTAHAGWVNLFYCDQNEEQGYFYGVQELADDESGREARELDPDGYQPRSLFGDLILRRRLSSSDALRAALILGGAVAMAHQQGLICPGLKSSSVFFVQGLPKFSGVTRAASSGALGEIDSGDDYAPPEGWGTPQADIYSLGKIIYALATGREAGQFLEWPDISSAAEKAVFLGLKRVVEKACAPDPRKRYAHGQALCADLQAVQSGRSLAPAAGGKIVLVAVALSAVALASFFFFKKGGAEKAPVVSAASQPVLPVSPPPEPVASAAPLSQNVKPSWPAPVLPPQTEPPSAAVPPVFQVGKVLFADDFDLDSSLQWTVLRSSDDTAAQFAYDYSVMGIPPAPGSSQALGLYLAANMALPKSQEVVCASPVGQKFTGNYRLRFHLWMNTVGPFPVGGVGSTQFMSMGVGTDGTRLHKAKPSLEDGIWFTVNGDGDANSTRDYTVYRANQVLGPASMGVYAAGSELAARGSDHPYYVQTFPGGQTPPAQQAERYPAIQTGAMGPGVLGFVWREVEIIKLDDRVTWMIDGLPIAAMNINAPNLDGNIFVGYEDIVDSVAQTPELCFAVVDNLVVEEIHPPGSVPNLPAAPLRATKTLFADDFDRDSAQQWSVQKTSDDTAVQFAYDYSAWGIPAAPGSKQTLGVRLAANLAAPPSQESICLSPLNQAFTGNYRLKFYLWMNFHGPFPEGGPGSSQVIMAGVGTDGTQPHRMFGADKKNDGAWFAVSGDGGLILDYGAYQADLALKCDHPGVYAASLASGGLDDTCLSGEHPYYVKTFTGGQKAPAWQRARYPSVQVNPVRPGTIGLTWRQVEIVKLGKLVTWSIDGLTMATVSMDGIPFADNIFIGYADSLEGVATQPELCFAIVDNLVVEAVEAP